MGTSGIKTASSAAEAILRVVLSGWSAVVRGGGFGWIEKASPGVVVVSVAIPPPTDAVVGRRHPYRHRVLLGRLTAGMGDVKHVENKNHTFRFP